RSKSNSSSNSSLPVSRRKAISSTFMSKWFSIDVLPGPVTKSTRFTPDWTSSSTTYCTTTLRPTGSISFGWLLVNGRSRVPSPAKGTMAKSLCMVLHHQFRWGTQGGIELSLLPSRGIMQCCYLIYVGEARDARAIVRTTSGAEGRVGAPGDRRGVVNERVTPEGPSH